MFENVQFCVSLFPWVELIELVFPSCITEFVQCIMKAY